MDMDLTSEQWVALALAVGWIVATVRGVRRMDAAEAHRERMRALGRVTDR